MIADSDLGKTFRIIRSYLKIENCKKRL